MGLRSREKAQRRRVELVDIKDFNLPLLDEPVSPIMGQYSKPHTKVWAAKIGSFDGYVFVTPEYNHGISGALKNTIDFLFREWNDNAAGFVSYGGAGGARAVEQLRLVLAEVQIATVRNQVLLSLFTDFENFSVFKPAPLHEKSVNAVFDQIIAWGGALKALRRKQVENLKLFLSRVDDLIARVSSSHQITSPEILLSLSSVNAAQESVLSARGLIAACQIQVVGANCAMILERALAASQEHPDYLECVARSNRN